MTAKVLDMRDVVVETRTNSSSLVKMKLTHTPTGATVNGSSVGQYKLKERLIKELEDKVNKGDL